MGLTERLGNTTSLSDVFKQFGTKLKKDMHVATLAYFQRVSKEFDGVYGKAIVKPFPLEKGQSEYELETYYFNDMNYEKGDVVTIIFVDIDGFDQIGNTVVYPTTNENRHSNSFGVMITNKQSDKKYYRHVVEIHSTSEIGDHDCYMYFITGSDELITEDNIDDYCDYFTNASFDTANGGHIQVNEDRTGYIVDDLPLSIHSAEDDIIEL